MADMYAIGQDRFEIGEENLVISGATSSPSPPSQIEIAELDLLPSILSLRGAYDRWHSLGAVLGTNGDEWGRMGTNGLGVLQLTCIHSLKTSSRPLTIASQYRRQHVAVAWPRICPGRPLGTRSRSRSRNRNRSRSRNCRCHVREGSPANGSPCRIGRIGRIGRGVADCALPNRAPCSAVALHGPSHSG